MTGSTKSSASCSRAALCDLSGNDATTNQGQFYGAVDWPSLTFTGIPVDAVACVERM